MKRILVCDDDHEIVQAICVYLTDAGFEIVQAYSGKEALQCVLDPDQQIDLIPYRHLNRQTGTVLLLNHELNLYQTEDGYMLEFPTMENIKKVEISRDGRQVRMYILP